MVNQIFLIQIREVNLAVMSLQITSKRHDIEISMDGKGCWMDSVLCFSHLIKKLKLHI